MIQTIRVMTTIGSDLLGASILSAIQQIGKDLQVEKVITARVFRLQGITKHEARLLAEKLFCESINQKYTLDEPVLNGVLQIREISYKSGVMNPEVASIIKAASDLGIAIVAADSSTEYGFYGAIKKEEINSLIQKLNLFNPTTEHIVIEEPKTLIISGSTGHTTTIPIRSMLNEQLLSLSRDTLFLNLEEMQVIQNYFKDLRRDPTDCELEVLAQTWSEHCAHKTFKAKLIVDGRQKEPLINRLKKEALKHKKNIVSAFVDNSGVMDFYDGNALCGKVETHNSPSAIEPYGGAATGSGGVFRDIVATGKGAKAIASTDIFCLAHPDLKASRLPSGCLPPSYLLKQVVRGVKDYGNRMGIPTLNGSVHFHNDFRAKPSIIVGSYGILQKKKAQKGKPRIGDVIVIVGGRTGKDGIHGATFSSGEMTDKTISLNSSAVQIGNAIEEKRMFDALTQAGNKNLIRAIQDCGAGGLSSAIGEMGETTGVTVHLEKVMLKYQGLSPWEIFLSESQERMALAIPKEKLNSFLKICDTYNVEACILGTFDGSKKLKVFYKRQKICDLAMQFVHHGLPQRVMIAKSTPIFLKEKKTQAAITKSDEWLVTFKKIISSGNICSKEPIVRLYDHSVQGTNDLQPYSGVRMDGPNDAAVLRPLLHQKYGMIVSHGLNPILNTFDPYWGSIWASAEALSNYAAVGGDYRSATLINNYIWPYPDESALWSLDRSVDAVVDVMKAFKIPVISGKDSLSSTYKGENGEVIKIPPVLCISVFGKIKDTTKTTTSDFKKVGSAIYLVGVQDIDAMGGSVYNQIQNREDGVIPHIDLKTLPKVLQAIYKGIASGKILSCHDVSEGGLLTSIFEMCVGGSIGAQLTISNQARVENYLFNETAGCFIVEIENESVAKKLFNNLPYHILGTTLKETVLSIKHNKKNLFVAELEDLKNAWKEPMEKMFS